SVRCHRTRLRRQWPVTIRPAISEELPGLSHFADHVEIEIGDQHFIFIAARLRDNLFARRAEVALAVEFAYVPWLLAAYAINRADEVSIRNCVRGLLKFPQIF